MLDSKLLVYQCQKCGRRTLIPQGYCTNCRARNSFHSLHVPGEGTVFSYTEIHVAEERLKEEVPYIVAVIECEGELRLMARIRREDSEQVAIGATVELVEWKEDTPLFKVSQYS
ncbi:Zn-ribbon domain-containing OB-fold protein [Bacillus piscicola]|uniref:Zn-ribbon domain-containing OB-fold protein n=1 Tax=Bacillus piscicola TaxID=1632684 RepID=UPI001F08F3DC|nr:OB-fold domain-containing protein [Bacillus piscicola]